MENRVHSEQSTPAGFKRPLTGFTAGRFPLAKQLVQDGVRGWLSDCRSV